MLYKSHDEKEKPKNETDRIGVCPSAVGGHTSNYPAQGGLDGRWLGRKRIATNFRKRTQILKSPRRNNEGNMGTVGNVKVLAELGQLVENRFNDVFTMVNATPTVTQRLDVITQSTGKSGAQAVPRTSPRDARMRDLIRSDMSLQKACDNSRGVSNL